MLPAYREGYEFEGWYLDDGYSIKVTELTPEISDDLTLYAKWKFMYSSYGYRVSLGSNFDLKYYIKLSDTLMADSSVFVEFVIDGKIQYARKSSVAGEYALYICEVPMKNISSRIEARLHYGDIYYPLHDYCIKTYLETIITNEDGIAEYAFAKDVAVSILDYGAYCQKYFGYNIDNLANAKYSSNNVENVSISDFEKDTISDFGCNSNLDFEFIGASLICNSDTDLRLVFLNKNNLTLSEIKEKYDCYIIGGSNPLITVEADGTFCSITIKSIPAMELDSKYHINIYNGEDNILIEYSPMTYIRKAMDSNDINLKNLCTALYLYNQAADSYYERYALVY